jgi:hypothetical protein
MAKESAALRGLIIAKTAKEEEDCVSELEIKVGLYPEKIKVT